MKKPSFAADLRRISDHVSFVNEYTYGIGPERHSVAYQQAYVRWTQPLDQFGRNHGEADKVRTSLTTHLAQTLYSRFYCADTSNPTTAAAGVDLTQMPSAEAREVTIRQLSAANATEAGIDPCWLVQSIDAQGNAFVRKNDTVRQLLPNEWTPMNPAETGGLKVGSVVGIRVQREDTALQPVFYHVRSAALPVQHADYTRLYFNTTFEGAVTLVRELTTVFNQYRVPFLFKCLNHPALFNRADSAVLYLDKASFRFGSELLHQVLPRVRPHLKASIPLFTRQLVTGVGFSEDPGAGQSFGMSRCTVLAEGLVAAFYRGASTPEAQYATVLDTFAQQGIDVAHIYLKPNSKFPYDFSVFSHA